MRKGAHWRQDWGPTISSDGALALWSRRAEGFWRLGVLSLLFSFVALTTPVMAFPVLVSHCKLRGCGDVFTDVVLAQGLVISVY